MKPLVLTWPKSNHSLRIVQEGDRLIATLILHKECGDQMIPVTGIPVHLRLQDIEKAWADQNGDWVQVYKFETDGGLYFEAVRLLRIPDRHCTLAWAVLHHNKQPSDVCRFHSGSASDDDIVAAYFDKRPAVAQIE